MTTHREELARLGRSYSWALQADISSLVNLVQRIAGRPAVFVGSGGALAVARFAADLHMYYSAALALGVTPLESIGIQPPADKCSVVVLSARLSHPDVWLAVEAAMKRSFSTVAIVTHRSLRDIDVPSVAKGVEIISLPTPIAKDGFLATNSVLTMATILLRSHGWERSSLPGMLPSLGRHTRRDRIAGRCMVVAPPGYMAISLDLEARLSELGISCVQLTDYRNLAHGRHTGLARTLNETTIVPIVAPRYASLAASTLGVLPKLARVVALSTDNDWPVGVLDLFVASMRMAGQQAEYAKIDAARPRVPLFGRRLYHFSARRFVQQRAYGPIDRKVHAAGFHVEAPIRGSYETAFGEWLEEMMSARLGGIALDYDGTVNATEARFGLPSRRIRQVLRRCLELGLVVGFASGRGRSLHRDLRQWVPQHWWDRISLGLYNGGTLLSLADDEPENLEDDQGIRELRERLKESPIRRLSEIEVGPMQLELRPSVGSRVNSMMLGRLTSELIGRGPHLRLKVVSSAHSVDVVPESSTKASVVEWVAERCGGGVLAIGDQGQIDGNDFELLASVRTSISVDQCSADPTRCWNLADATSPGPDTLVRYLMALRRAGRTARFHWRVDEGRTR
jgi:hypothetical protein